MRNLMLVCAGLLSALAALMAGCGSQPVRTPEQASLLSSCVQRAGQEDAGPRAPTAAVLLPRSMLPARFPDAARVLGLNPEEAIMLFDIIAAHEADGTFGFATAPGNPPQPPASVGAALTRQAARDNCILALLGDRSERWEPYRASLPVRTQVYRLREMLAASNQPISDARAESLIAAIHAQRRPPEWASAGAVQDIRQVDVNMNARVQAHMNEQTLEIAGHWLDQGQLAVFRQMLDESRVSTFELLQRIQMPPQDFRPPLPVPPPQPP